MTRTWNRDRVLESSLPHQIVDAAGAQVVGRVYVRQGPASRRLNSYRRAWDQGDKGATGFLDPWTWRVEPIKEAV